MQASVEVITTRPEVNLHMLAVVTAMKRGRITHLSWVDEETSQLIVIQQSLEMKQTCGSEVTPLVAFRCCIR